MLRLATHRRVQCTWKASPPCPLWRNSARGPPIAEVNGEVRMVARSIPTRLPTLSQSVVYDILKHL